MVFVHRTLLTYLVVIRNVLYCDVTQLYMTIPCRVCALLLMFTWRKMNMNCINNR